MPVSQSAFWAIQHKQQASENTKNTADMAEICFATPSTIPPRPDKKLLRGVRQQQETKKSKNFLQAARTLILSSMRHLNDFYSYHLFIGLSNLIFASSVKGLSLLLAPVFKR